MLLCIAPGLKVAAQNQKIDYSVRKLCSDTLIITEGMRSDTMSIKDALRINEAYPMQKQVDRNTIIFKEMKK